MKRSPPVTTTRDGAGMLSGEQRLNKLLAAAGLGARRQVDELIEQGRVEVDGKIVEQFGMKVDAAIARITVDGTPLKRLRPAYFALHKPTGVLCTNRDPQGRSRAIDMVPGQERLFPVGRLDASSVGLLLLTNDGELAQQLTHPKYGVPKTYYVVVAGQLEPDQMKRLRRGIYLSDGVARVDFVKIKKVRKGSTELEITLSEGKNREIRRVLARLGHKVVTLRRLSIGPLKMGDLPVGAYRPLTKEEVAALYRAAEDAKRARRKRKETNEEHDSEREERLLKKEAKQAALGETGEASKGDTTSAPTAKSKPAGPRSRKPIKEVINRTPSPSKTRDPFDWDDDELLLASPFAANHPSAGSDEADDDDDGWVTPLMAGMNEDDDDEMPGKSFHQSAVGFDAILLRDGDTDRVGDVIDYDDEEDSSDERPARQPRGRSPAKSAKRPAKRSFGRDDSQASENKPYKKKSGSQTRNAKSARTPSSRSRPDSKERSGFERNSSERNSADRSTGGRTTGGRKKSSKKFAPGKRSAKGAAGRSTTGVSESTGRGRAERTVAKRKPIVKKGGPRSGANTKRASVKRSPVKRTKRAKR